MERVEADGDEPGAARALAALLVVGLACLLALLPAALALRSFAPPPASVVPAVAALGVVVLALKSVATVWRRAVRAWSAHKGSVAAAHLD